MANLIADVLPQAIGVALSSAPIIAMILLLFGTHARRNGLAFMFGWMVGCAVMTLLAVGLAYAGRISTADGSLLFTDSTRLLIGLIFLYLAYYNWRCRPSPGKEPEEPEWIATLNAITPEKSFGFAFFLAVANPKNVGLILSAGLIIAQAGLNNPQTWMTIFLFVFVCSLIVIVPLVFYLLARTPAEKILTSWKCWLIAKNNTIQIVLFLVFGVWLVIIGLNGLLG